MHNVGLVDMAIDQFFPPIYDDYYDQILIIFINLCILYTNYCIYIFPSYLFRMK